MSTKRLGVIALGTITTAYILYRLFLISPDGEMAGKNTLLIANRISPTDTVLLFTAPGCESLPYVSALKGSGAERLPLEPFPATDGYDYAVIEGTRQMRDILSRFTGSCENISPAPMDTFQVLEVGVTEDDEEFTEETI
jgi:hypothetical protein